MPRLGSRKSRTGCKRCKERRVKCDEQVPCGSCARREEECSYADPFRTHDSETADDQALQVDSEEWIPDLELMHHYPAALCHLGAREKVVNLWREQIVEQAFEHTFLMHGLLAFSALYLAHLRPHSQAKYLRLSDKHQDIALGKFRSILSSPVNPEFAEALFALSVILSLSSMARSCAVASSATVNMDAVAEQFILTKGVANCINLSLEHIQQSPLAEMLKRTTCPDGTTIHLPIRVASRLEAIWHMTATYELDEEARVDCHCAFMNVERLYKSMVYFCQRGTEIEISIFSEWQVAVSMGFIKLIQARHTLALVILAYYAASLTAIRTAWYTQNWAEFVLYEISQMLEDEMKQWIQWPMEQIQQRMSELLVQSPAHISTTT